MRTEVEVAALSDVGSVRSNNEDSFGYHAARQVYVVCDGMGGMAAGEVASQMAVATLLQIVTLGDQSTPVEMTLHRAIAAANASVHNAGQLPAHKGMGTTLVAACVDGSKLYIGNVGDSRAYLIQGHHCQQLTVDHSYVNELIRTGAIAVENAATVDLKGMESVITRAIGVAPSVEPDFFSIDLTAGDVILLASDGLTRYVDSSEIGRIVSNADLQLSAEQLIALAKARGGADNITALLLHIRSVSSQ